MRLKFWDKSQEEPPKVPDDITHFNEVEPYYRNHLGATKDSAATNGVAWAAAATVIFFVGVGAYLYFWVFLLHT